MIGDILRQCIRMFKIKWSLKIALHLQLSSNLTNLATGIMKNENETEKSLNNSSVRSIPEAK